MVYFGIFMLVILIPILLLGISCTIYDRLYPTAGHVWARKIYCEIFPWHNGSGIIKDFDGCSFKSTCSRCGKEVMMDSQGNWF